MQIAVKCLKYRKDNKGKNASIAVKKYNIKNKHKISAWTKVKYNIKTGKIMESGCCVCGGKAEAHHIDYKYPLKIIWLCKKHHKIEHKKTLVKNA